MSTPAKQPPKVMPFSTGTDSVPYPDSDTGDHPSVQIKSPPSDSTGPPEPVLVVVTTTSATPKKSEGAAAHDNQGHPAKPSAGHTTHAA